MRLILNMPADVTPEKIRLLKSKYGKQTIVVLVHASWCGHCTAFRPDWNRFCESRPELLLVELESDAIERLAAYDAEAFSLLARDVTGFPTVFMYRMGVRPTRVPFDKQRSMDGLKEFVGKPASAPAKPKAAPAKPKAAPAKPKTAPAKPKTAPAKPKTAAPFSSPKSPKSAPQKKSI